MTLTASEHDVETIEHLDPGDDIACEVLRSSLTPCGEPATWWVICGRCQHHSAFCERHLAAYMLSLPRMRYERVKCPACEHVIPAPLWVFLCGFREIHPGGAS